MRIGIYGGSFNPVHKGHTSLAKFIVEKGFVDELWLLVSPLNPLKQTSSNDIASYEHRIQMAELATESVKGVKVSDFESRLPIPSYTVNTLKALTKAYPEHTFALIIGADNLQCIGRWYKHEEIMSNYDILVYRRPGYDIDKETLPKRVKLVDTPLYDISSTQIRHAVKSENEDLQKQWIDERVKKYIKDQNLYLN